MEFTLFSAVMVIVYYLIYVAFVAFLTDAIIRKIGR